MGIKQGIIKRSIPTITGLLMGLFLFDFQQKKGLANLVIYILIGGILFNLMWVSYAKFALKGSKKQLESDALTFIPFLALIFFPVKYFIDLGQNLSQFSNIPSSLLLIFSISSFIFLKVLFYSRGMKDIKSDRWVYFIAILYFILFSALAVFKHLAFFSTAYDLAIYDQGVW